MARKMQNIYEFLGNYTEKEIDEMIDCLSPEEQTLIRNRYGEDLHNPVKSDSFTPANTKKYYTILVPKMRLLLAERKIKYLEAKSIENKELELKKQLLELLKKDNNNEEILKILNINTQQLYKLLLDLQNTGTMISRKYYSNGTIKYKKSHTFGEFVNKSFSESDKTIITDNNENNLKFLVISDLHFGNQSERLDLVNRAYNYCAKNGINIILSGGDLIDGAFSQREQKISDLYSQIEYFIKNYPYDKNILTFSVAGDHDISAFRKESLNLIQMCNNYRHDIIIGAYNNTGINIKNDKISLQHFIIGGYFQKTDAPLILYGHHHRYTTRMKDNALNVYIPSLSDINESLPSALELELNFNKGFIEKAIIKQILFGNKDIVLSESVFDLLTNRTVQQGSIKNIEPYKKNDSVEVEEKRLVKEIQRPLSQIEKFNKRYGK